MSLQEHELHQIRIGLKVFKGSLVFDNWFEEKRVSGVATLVSDSLDEDGWKISVWMVEGEPFIFRSKVVDGVAHRKITAGERLVQELQKAGAVTFSEQEGTT